MVIGELMGTNIFDEMYQAVDAMLKTLSTDPNFAAMVGENNSVDQVLEQMRAMYEAAIKMLPETLCIFALLASYVDYIILSKVLKPGGIAPIPMTKLQEFDLPRRMVTVWCLIYLAALLLSETEALANSAVFLNVMMLFNMAFVLQGVSVIFMFCAVKRVPKAVTVILTILLLSMSVGGLVIRLLGFTDLLFGLKYRMKQKI
jgi:uncharacterized protein YybS (DUF2232 family)